MPGSSVIPRLLYCRLLFPASSNFQHIYNIYIYVPYWLVPVGYPLLAIAIAIVPAWAEYCLLPSVQSSLSLQHVEVLHENGSVICCTPDVCLTQKGLNNTNRHSPQEDIIARTIGLHFLVPTGYNYLLIVIAINGISIDVNDISIWVFQACSKVFF